MTKMHLLWFCAFSPHAGFGLDGWAGPHTGTGYDWTQPELWQDMAAALERAKFDLLLLGDSLAVPGTYQGRMDAYLRYAEHAPFHAPSPLVAMLAAATRRICMALTLSTTFYPPFLLARLLTTLDHLSRGRMAWNVVTSYKHEEALNFGYQELLDHDQRYDRADVSGCLWDSGAALHARRGRRGAGAAGEGEVRGAACRGAVCALLTRLRRLYAPGTLPCPCRWGILALEAAPAEAVWSCAGVGAYDG